MNTRLPLLSCLLVLMFSNIAFSQIANFNTLDVPESTGQCGDSPPVNDGFGWNGVCSCALGDVTGFGSSISMDGNQAAIGVAQTPDGCVGSGSVSVFELSDSGEWLRQADLVSSNRLPNDGFPIMSSISDNTVIASSSVRLSYSDFINTNYLHVFTVIDNQWRETQQIQVDTTLFAHDGDTLAVMPIRPEGGTLPDRLLVLKKDQDGIWQRDAELVITDTPSFRAIAHFDVHGDTIVVASQQIPRTLMIYERTAGSWQLQQQFEVPRNAISSAHDIYNPDSSLDVSENTIVLVPGRWTDGLKSAYTFSRTDNGSWVEDTGVAVPDPDPLLSPTMAAPPFGLLSPGGDNLLFVRGIYYDTIRGASWWRDRHADLFLFNNTDGSWGAGESVSFTTEGVDFTSGDYKAGFNGKNILLATGNDNTVLALNVDDAGRIVTDFDSTVTQTGCDYSNADVFDGWGWNASTGESCAPLETVNDLQPSAQCIDSDGDGWGWDGTGSCTVNAGTTVTTTVDPSCDYSDADVNGGWGWNATINQSCAPLETVVVTQPAAQCIDTDGDGWGWDGSASCRP